MGFTCLVVVAEGITDEADYTDNDDNKDDFDNRETFLTDKTTYDFEVMPYVASAKDECKNGGWMNFQADYKNQRQCVSGVASNRH